MITYREYTRSDNVLQLGPLYNSELKKKSTDGWKKYV
jgi:hypothetical protein